jgi:glycine/D-amino acid oxidase-like deaminating enzyme
MHTIIVGAGITGLWLAEQLALRGDKVTVLEKADYLGGRIVSSDRGYEIGAGRIATHHTHVMELIRRFGLKTYPISGGGGLWLDGSGIESNKFDVNWSTFLHTFARLSPHVLATRTLKQIATNVLGPKQTDRLLSHFGYRGETEVLRADLGLQAFQAEMAPDSQFVVVAGGLTQVIKGLARAARKAGATILLNTTVNDVTEQFNVHTNRGVMTADRVILAIPSQALKRLPCTRNLPVLRHLRMEPLTRIYATFDAPWPIQERIVTDSPLRYIIPIRDNLVMISYTEAQDTQAFKGLQGPALRKALQKEVQKILPESPDSPKITWAYAYEWAHGCTYWLPGTYDPAVESQKALQVRPGLHLCNESFSLRQAWVEGSLEHATSLLAIL